ncbi:HTH-type transcriptional regulator TsaQ1/TsaQ2 [Pandoraea terrae]|uniref:HTH-type transcriptional regulator TsaQ1/TsaQ2 n=1 Tax=Pandoraea terrae TaxID=1537710 RepID=A0A5E4UP35_9BURK|nr:IclR family transcriptional regulator [Pandoraea terrae]VVE01294.1 HTH-type transcriptional regulator TsaQ1/TsaQ2 [Pandoraea terrae]
MSVSKPLLPAAGEAFAHGVPPSHDERKFVTALARGLELLRAFRPDDAMLGNRDLAARTGLPKATISRLAYTLTELGYLRYDAELGKYALDAGVLALGYAFLSGADMLTIARPHMRALAREMGCSISLGCREGLDMMYLETMRSDAALTLGLTSGSRLSMLTSSMGRVYLAVLTPPEREATLAALRAQHAGDWPALAAGVEKGIETYRREGCCYSFREWHEGVNAVAVPLRDVRQNRWLAISCSGPASSVSETKFREEIAPRLKALAARLSGQG